MEPASVPTSLSEKHAHLVPIVAAIERTEASVGEEPPARLRFVTLDLYENLAHELMPHAAGEGRTVFPVLRRVTGDDEQAVALTEQHRRIAQLTDDLDRVRAQMTKGEPGTDALLVRVLDDLHRELTEHFAAEEEVCFTVLKRELSAEQAAEVCEAMERATQEIRRSYE
jgi:iron-sulfur cluster repair protein YtfE (RIC family)